VSRPKRYQIFDILSAKGNILGALTPCLNESLQDSDLYKILTEKNFPYVNYQTTVTTCGNTYYSGGFGTKM